MSPKRVSRGEDEKAKTPVKKRVTVEEFYAQEDQMASAAGTPALYEAFQKEASLLREQLENVEKGEPCSPEVVLRVAAMRRLMRLTMFNNKRLKEETQAKMESFEAKYLALQNVSSEIDHIKKEITRCQEFRSGDEDVELVPLEEFYATAPESISKPEVTNSDEHEQKMARLNWELQQRKELVGTLQEQEGRRAVLVSDINGKEQRLKSLKPKIDDLIKAARPLQEVLGGTIKGNALGGASERHLGALLPHDLSVLYVQAEAYKDIMKDSSMTVQILGDATEAAKWSKSQAEEGEEQKEENDSDNEDGDNANEDRRHQNLTEVLEANRKKLETPHPISVQINVGCQDDITVKMKLCYMPELRSTFMRWKISGKLPSAGGVCADDVLLHELFPGDTGAECSNPIGAAKLQHLKITMDDLSPRLGRPYKFVQTLAGADGPVEGLRLADAIQSTVQAIRDRVKHRIALAQQIKQLETCRLWEAADAATGVPSPPPKMITDMKSFKMITEEQYLTSVTESTRELTVAEESASAFYAHSQFEHKMAGATMSCHVFIPVDYPRHPPLLSLSVTLSGTVKTAQTTSWVKTLERYVNVECLGACKPSHLLLHQMTVLCSRFDLCLQCLPGLSEKLKTGGQPVTRAARGRTCDPPLEFNESSKSFSFS